MASQVQRIITSTALRVSHFFTHNKEKFASTALPPMLLYEHCTVHLYFSVLKSMNLSICRTTYPSTFYFVSVNLIYLSYMYDLYLSQSNLICWILDHLSFNQFFFFNFNPFLQSVYNTFQCDVIYRLYEGSLVHNSYFSKKHYF